MRPHVRNCVIVHGDKPPYEGNESYYDSADNLVKKLAEEMGAKVVGYDLREEPGDGIFEYVSNSKEFCKTLAERLRDLRLYKEIEIKTHTVHLDLPQGNH